MRKKLKLRQPQPLSHCNHWNHCNHCTTEAATASAQLEIFEKMIFMATLTELPELRPPIDSFAVLLVGIECRTRSDHHRRATMVITHWGKQSLLCKKEFYSIMSVSCWKCLTITAFKVYVYYIKKMKYFSFYFNSKSFAPHVLFCKSKKGNTNLNNYLFNPNVRYYHCSKFRKNCSNFIFLWLQSGWFLGFAAMTAT